MNILYFKAALLLISAVCILWGGLITLSERYFRYWQNAYWKEENEHQWSIESTKINRWGKGFGALIFGIGLAYLAIYQIH